MTRSINLARVRSFRLETIVRQRIEEFVRFAIRRPKTILGIAVLLTGILIPGVFLLEKRAVLDGDLPANDVRVRDDKQMKNLFSHRNFYLVDLHCEEGVFAQRCINWMQRVTREAEKTIGLSSPVETLVTSKYNPASQESIVWQNVFREGETDLSRAERLILQDPLRSSRLLSKSADGLFDGSLLVFALRDDVSQQDAHATITGLMDLSEKGHQVRGIGRHYINQELDNGIGRDAPRLLGLSLLIIIVVVTLSLGGRSNIIIFMIIGASMMWCLGLMGYLGIPLSVLSGSIPGVLVAAISSVGFHVIYRIRQEFRPVGEHPVENAIVRGFREVGPATLWGQMISIAGFITLYAFAIFSVREFGLAIALGVLSGLVASFLIIPASLATFLSSIITRDQTRLSKSFEQLNRRILSFWATLATSHHLAVLTGTFVVLGISLVGISSLSEGINVVKLFHRDLPVRVQFENLQERYGGNGFVSVMLDSGKEGNIFEPDFIRRTEAYLTAVESYPGVVYVVSPLDAIMAVNRVLHAGDPFFEVIPETRSEAAQSWFLYASSEPGSARHMASNDGRYLMADFFIVISDSKKIDALYDFCRKTAEQVFGRESEVVHPGGEFFIWSAQNRYIVEGKIRNIMWNIPLTFFVCLLAFGSVRIAGLALVPVSVAVMVVFGIIGFLGIRLDLATCAITSIVTALGDFSMHFLARVRHLTQYYGVGGREVVREAIMTGGLPIHYDCLSNFAFLALLGSSFTPVQDFGWLISLAMLISLISTLLVLPALIVFLRRDSIVLSSKAA